MIPHLSSMVMIFPSWIVLYHYLSIALSRGKGVGDALIRWYIIYGGYPHRDYGNPILVCLTIAQSLNTQTLIGNSSLISQTGYMRRLQRSCLEARFVRAKDVFCPTKQGTKRTGRLYHYRRDTNRQDRLTVA